MGPEQPVEPVEVEVKFGVARPDILRALLESPEPDMLAGFAPRGPLREVTVVDRYLDTAREDGRLFLAGMRARLRESGGAVTLTVKRRGTLSAGITTRTELEGPAGPGLDPEAWPASDARAALRAVLDGTSLVEIATLRQRRLVRDVGRGGTFVEVSLDDLEAFEGETVVRRRVELEAELKAGDVGALEDLAGALSAIDGVGPPLGSKLEFALGITRSMRAPDAPGG